MTNDDRQQTVDEFEGSVNMTRKELEDWLQTEESGSVGQGEGESKGHESGRRIVGFLEKNKSDYTDDDLDHMKKVNSYVKRHLGQGPKNAPEDSKWRYSLINFSYTTLRAAQPERRPRPKAGRGTGADSAGRGHPGTPEVNSMAKDRQQIIEEFDEAVNMTRKELEDWLQTDESQSVGQSDGSGESKGHESGRKIVEILEKNKSDYTDEDIDHMQRVVSYVHRHQAQKPSGDVEDSTWRYSLLNWGHDPLK